MEALQKKTNKWLISTRKVRLVIRKFQIKTTTYYYVTTRMLVLKRLTMSSKDVEQLKLSYIAHENVK